MTNKPPNPNLNPKTLEGHNPGATRKQFLEALKLVIKSKPKKEPTPNTEPPSQA